jgi:hypothetical protein
LAGLRHNLDLGLLRLLALGDRAALATASALAALTGLRPSHLCAIVAAALAHRLLVGSLALATLAADRLFVGWDGLSAMALLAADLAVHIAVIPASGRRAGPGHRQATEHDRGGAKADHEVPKCCHVIPSFCEDT